MDDNPGRIMGSTCGIQAWKCARKYFDGSIANDEVNATIELDAFNNCTIGWNSLPSFSYKVEASVDLKNFFPLSGGQQGHEYANSFNLSMPGAEKLFFRVTKTVAKN